ncbi:6-pyruvoyl tetrahydropterin synthase family protein [Litoribrevibacter euphylliae]|uniref:6-carboxy-5,6,7,8-tetrahydropterin synthase n=1 Tax=Litoribrevibacter euphylliae TaxID=1834034 RepID=A0ABV7H734_9GAMM
MTSLFVDQLTVIDFSYLHNERGLLGESWLVDCELAGELNDEGMLFDFGHVKKTIKNFIDDFADHKLIVATSTPGLELNRQDEGAINIQWQHQKRYLNTTAPAEAFLFLDAPAVTIEVLAAEMEQELLKILPNNVAGVKLNLYCESIQGAFYHYSHGLKKHDGNCQRIAHGHRSPIQIFIDNQRNQTLEKQWAETFTDIYIGTREDITKDSETADDRISFNYHAPQGEFSLTINRDQVYLIETDSTVEWISDHIAKTIHGSYPQSRVKVKAFEGYRKGSISEY